MNLPKHVEEHIAAGRSGLILVTESHENQIILRNLGSYEKIRHMYNQCGCILGAAAMLKSTPPGTEPPEWYLRNLEITLRSIPEILSLACEEKPSFLSDAIGLSIRYYHWPQDASSTPGMQNALKALLELGVLFHDFKFYPSIPVGSPKFTSLKKRIIEGIQIANMHGYTLFHEKELIEFVSLMSKAKYLQFCHRTEF